MEESSMAQPTAEEPLSRRERARADTFAEIKRTAREVLVRSGAEGLALRAVAREMGMTAPGLYRYFASREDLVEHVVADLYDDLCDRLEAARDDARPAVPAVQLLAVSREFRRWATTHVAEFGLLFGSAGDGLPSEEGVAEGPAALAGQRFAAVFGTLVAQIWLDRRFPVPAEEEIQPALRAQLREWGAHVPVDLPLGVLRVFLSCWVRLYGLVCMEIFGHLRFALADAEPLFEDELRLLADLLCVADQYVPAG
jgi:AcrR family transcriptional regulator